MSTATTTGAIRPQSAQPLRTPTLSGNTFPPSDLSYAETPNGVLVTANGLMVAWIYPGHAGSRNNPRACQFYDVAYPSLTFGQQNRVTGIMLDSASFDSLAEAVAFVESTFGEVQA